ncbi:hypothetical protein EDC24_1526 [Aquisalibacillus elongatus]|uniref:Cytochrome c/quinol oxidase subunit I n=2 Tax=Aquisalibacillus elongatus TaxID=485577 RepID=A0A3N5BBL8_9BACI|nr:hypothetical protein EDC24_1526 [Aquisalibacillus elongatus]
MVKWMFRLSVLYFLIGVLMGQYMSQAQDYVLTGVHVHINLIGWVSFALAGVIYKLYPDAANNWMAKGHFWLHTIGLPLFMYALAQYIQGADFAGFVAFGMMMSYAIILGVVLFVINVFVNVKD